MGELLTGGLTQTGQWLARKHRAFQLKCSEKSKYFDFSEHFSNFAVVNYFNYET